MANKIINKGAFLRGQRLFPQEAQPLSVEIDRSYVEMASKINDKTIGFFTTSSSAVTGEKWQIDGKTYNGFRQMYTFETTGNIEHLLQLENILAFTRIYGTFVDSSDPDPDLWIWYPLPYVDATAADNQVSLTVTSTDIVITAGGGSPPAVSSGYVVLEWIS